MVLSWSASDKYKVKNTWNLLYSSTITAKTVTSSPNSTSKSGPFFGKNVFAKTPTGPTLNSSGARWSSPYFKYKDFKRFWSHPVIGWCYRRRDLIGWVCHLASISLKTLFILCWSFGHMIYSSCRSQYDISTKDLTIRTNNSATTAFPFLLLDLLAEEG